MAVAIRLKRIGKHKMPYYRVVAIDRRQAAQGKPLEVLGSYDPRAVKLKDKVTINQERYDHWIKSGAKPSETLAALLKSIACGKEGRKKVKKSRKLIAKEKAAAKTPEKKEEAAEAEKAPEKKEEAADAEKA
ncbi:MAG: 30S ribosomal protein S16 [Elusimicrobiota bacterium]